MPPPRSPVPDGAAAIARARATTACAAGVQAQAKLDHLSDQGRFRGDLLLFAVAPARIRMDVVSPFGVALATLTSDGRRFALSDLRDKRFLVGPAEACNLARMTSVALPPHVLVTLLRGQPPLLVHDDASTRLTWSGRGHWVVELTSSRGAAQEIHLAPHPADLDRPWSEQRLRLTEVIVRQEGRIAWRATLEDHAPIATAAPRVDPDGIEPPIPPSGPPCDAELPRKLHVEVPGDGQDVRIRYDQATWNPPLPEGVFAQPPPPGLPVEQVECR